MSIPRSDPVLTLLSSSASKTPLECLNQGEILQICVLHLDRNGRIPGEIAREHTIILERRTLCFVFQMTGGDKVNAARLLGID